MRNGPNDSSRQCDGRWMRVTTTSFPAPDIDGRAAPARRLLFVSSVTTGGSGRSQRELAMAVREQGRTVQFLVEDPNATGVRRRALSELADASVRFEGSRLGAHVQSLRRRIGSGTAALHVDGVEHHAAPAPEHAFEPLVRSWRPDVVVVSSISRVSWRAIRSVCRRRGLPTALYLREATAIGHLHAGLQPDLLLANSGSLVEDAERLGHVASLVPSLVEVAPMAQPPSGEVVLLVNPLPSHGLDVVGPLAAARPDIPFVLQESWTLDRPARAAVDRLVRDHPNVTLRAFEPRPGRLFRDARILLAPHRIDNRPRTALEAQANGVPVVASGLPGLVEAVGDGGTLVDPDAGPDAWVRAISRLWDDERQWMAAGDRARMHAGRADVRPARVAERFCELVDDLVRADAVDQKSSMSPSENRN
ncbi:MAG: glycosyltransferase [Acidimicrobiales bacterium]|nr:glycosyltransferase [Acidimicrobiales bacterium]